MKILQKMLALLLIGAQAVFLASCGDAGAAEGSQDGRLKIVATIFPEYDWVEQLLGERAQEAEVTMLLDSGVDLHSYQPTAEDMMRIAGCDLFIYVGGESDTWVEDALSEATNQNMRVINLLSTLGDKVKEEELIEGMEPEEEDDEDVEEPEYDEHVWLSLKNAAAICEEITETLSALDPDHAAVYAANLESYRARLDDLDEAYRQAVGAAKLQTLLFGDRFPFRYLTDDYALSYYAAFAGCSAETEASFETIVFLAGKMDELGLPAVITIEGSDGRIAETIRDNTAAKDQAILVLDSMQSATAKDVSEGVSYLSIMEQNLEVLRKALLS